MKRYKIEPLLMVKNVMLYTIIFIVANFFKLGNSLLLFSTMFALILYDAFQRFRMMLLEVVIYVDDGSFKIIVINNFKRNKHIVNKKDCKMYFEDRVYGRGGKITFFTIMCGSEKVCDIKIPSDGWSRKKLDEMVTAVGHGGNE